MARLDPITIDHVLTVADMPMAFIRTLFMKTKEMKECVELSSNCSRLQMNKVVGLLFLEPSTRTRLSFTSAANRLGASVITVSGLDQQSSFAKGESQSDTMKALEAYCDCVVIRHPAVHGVSDLAKDISIPVVNAGDGSGEHPTQALLDLFTIMTELDRMRPGESSLLDSFYLPQLLVAFVGDLKHGRTVHSLALMLSNFPNIRIVYVSPPGLAPPVELFAQIASKGICQTFVCDLKEIISSCDVLYMTRIQRERFSEPDSYHHYEKEYCIDPQMMKLSKETMILMHPLPRLTEISVEVDSDPRAAYFRQMKNGLFVRMALLDTLMAQGQYAT